MTGTRNIRLGIKVNTWRPTSSYLASDKHKLINELPDVFQHLKEEVFGASESCFYYWYKTFKYPIECDLI